LNEIEKLSDELDLGKEVKAFWASSLGVYLMDRVEKYEAQLLIEFTNVDPNNPAAILKVQAQTDVPRLFVNWLNEAISAGEAAGLQLKQEQEIYEENF
jgi:hypothetical protein